MDKYPLWIMALVCFIGVATWMVVKRKATKDVWESTPGGPYQVIISDESISCVHPQRATETIRWDDIDEIRLVTTSDGPFSPDQWYLFVGTGGGCSVPSEAKGFEALWNVFKTRFPGFDYEGIIDARATENQRVLWTKSSTQ
ncbi:MAG: hypothetical protein ACO1RA_02190 [Planctomycetaceae bacterium]